LPIDACVETPQKVAQIIAAAHWLGAAHGMLVTVPVPREEAMPDDEAEVAIRQATDEAAAQGVHGKAVTPFVLARVAELTGGESKRANVALLVNNARVGGQIAAALVELES
jgi:pseudouridine-5'-phosphate glycosidase